MPTRPSVAASTLGGGGGGEGRANLRNASVTFSLFSSAVPSGSGAFLMPSCPSSVCLSVKIEGGGGGANLRNASVTFSLFWHEASLG